MDNGNALVRIGERRLPCCVDLMVSLSNHESLPPRKRGGGNTVAATSSFDKLRKRSTEAAGPTDHILPTPLPLHHPLRYCW